MIETFLQEAFSKSNRTFWLIRYYLVALQGNNTKIDVCTLQIFYFLLKL